MTRNRLKSEQGELWLSVPVHRKGRGLQVIREVEIFQKPNWRRKHVLSIEQRYANAPYLDECLPAIKQIYALNHKRLANLNIGLIKLFWDVFGLTTELLVESDLGVGGRGTDLIVNICGRLGATHYLSFPTAAKYLDVAALTRAGIQLEVVPFYPPVYPQLWGDFIPNLSVLDMVLNCGPASVAILSRG
jgi:hypothetical protein